MIRKYSRLLFSLIIALIFIGGLCLTTDAYLSDVNNICLWVLAFIYFFLFQYFIFFKGMISKIRKLRSFLSVLLISILITPLIILVLPIRYENTIDNNHIEKIIKSNRVIEIEALGEKNQESSGYEIWLEGIVVDSKDYNLYEIALDKPWEFIDGRIVNTSNEKSKLTIALDEGGFYQLLFRKQENAGKVKVTIGEYVHVYDLYSDKYEQRAVIDLKELLIKYNQNDKLSVSKIIFIMLEFIIIWMILFTAITYSYSYHLKKQKNNSK